MRMVNDRKAKGQSTAEYAVVIAIVLGAVIGMQTFVKRGLQARYKVASDSLASTKGSGTGTELDNFVSNLGQYEPYYAQQAITTNRGESYNETYVLGKFGKPGTISNLTRNGTQNEGVNMAADNGW